MFATAPSIHHDDEEADEGQDEGGIRGGIVTQHSALVDDHRLQRGQHGTAEDGHDESCCSKLGIVAKAVEGNAIDGREHERHATAYAYQTIDAHSILEHDDAKGKHHCQHGEDGKQLGRLQPLHEIGGNEARADEEQHRKDIEALRQHLCALLVHAFRHEHARTI